MDIFKIVELAVTAGGAFLVWQQLRFARKELKDIFTYQKREKAVELAKYFEKLLEDALIVTLVIEKSKISKIMKNLKINEKRIILKEFNSFELKKIIPKFEKEYKDKRFSDFLKEIKDKDLKKIFMDYSLTYENQEKAIEIIKRIMLKNMNRLEHFSMCFISDIACSACFTISFLSDFILYWNIACFGLLLSNAKTSSENLLGRTSIIL